MRRRLVHFLDHDYNRQPHEALDGQTPLDRFEAGTRVRRFPTATPRAPTAGGLR